MSQSGLLTVEEASERLGVSPSTVRRWCQTGKLTAEKTGKQWLVQASSLPHRARRPRSLQLQGFDLRKAIEHLTRLDLKELWVPDVLRHQDQLAGVDDLLAAASERLDGQGSFDPALEVEVPKTPFFTRAGTLLSLEDRVAYHGAVLTLAERIERLLLPSVYSARRSLDERYLLLKGRDQWLRWRDAVVAAIRNGFAVMLKTDITSYFDNIYHRLLFSQIDALNPDSKVAQALKRMLAEWASVPGQGLPQGPDASRLLGNLYLTPIDQTMEQGNWVYLRYMDDIRILGRSRAEAIAGMRALEREGKKLGLALSAKKTAMLVGDSAVADFEDEELRTVQYWVQTRPGSKVRKVLRGILAKAIRADGVDDKRARFCLWRLTLLRDHYGLRLVLKRLEDLAPLASIVAAYLRPWLARARVERGITEFLSDSERDTSPFLSTWLMAAMLDRPNQLPTDWIAYGRSVAFDRNQAAYHRTVAVNLMARGSLAADLAWIKRQLGTEFDPAFVRACLVALARVRALDRATSARAEVRFPHLARTTGYLRGRATLPSLIFSDRTVPVG